MTYKIEMSLQGVVMALEQLIEDLRNEREAQDVDDGELYQNTDDFDHFFLGSIARCMEAPALSHFGGSAYILPVLYGWLSDERINREVADSVWEVVERASYTDSDGGSHHGGIEDLRLYLEDGKSMFRSKAYMADASMSDVVDVEDVFEKLENSEEFQKYEYWRPIITTLRRFLRFINNPVCTKAVEHYSRISDYGDFREGAYPLDPWAGVRVHFFDP